MSTGDTGRDVTIRFFAEDVNLVDTLEDIGNTIERKTEPNLKLIKSNFVRLQQLLRDTNKKVAENKSWMQKLGEGAESAGGKIYRMGRTMGFTGFVLDVTFSRVLKMFTDFSKGVAGFVKGIGTTDAALNFLEGTLSRLAMAGLLDEDGEMVDNVVKNFWDWWNASRELEGQLALLENNLAPLKTILIEVATEGLGEINTALAEFVDNEAVLCILTSSLTLILAKQLNIAAISIADNS